MDIYAKPATVCYAHTGMVMKSEATVRAHTCLKASKAPVYPFHSAPQPLVTVTCIYTRR